MRKQHFFLLIMAIVMMSFQQAYADMPKKVGEVEGRYGLDSEYDDYYAIATAADLAAFRDYVNESRDHNHACAVLVANIDLSTVCHPADAANGVAEVSWAPIGKGGAGEYDCNNTWVGTFYGNGNIIENLYINDESQDEFHALFGFAGYNSVISTVYLDNVNVTGYNSVAAVCANSVGTIRDVQVVGGVVSATNAYAAGIVACGNNVANCHNYATIKGHVVAGVVEYAFGNIELCSNHGELQSISVGAAGILCQGQGQCTVSNCVNYGKITLDNERSSEYGCGGILGNSWHSTVVNCANFGDIYTTVDNDRIGIIIGDGRIRKTEGAFVSTGKVYVNGVEKTGVPTIGTTCAWTEDNVQKESVDFLTTAGDVATGKYAVILEACSGETNHIWGQLLTGTSKQAYPIISGERVYADKKTCKGMPLEGSQYSNTETTATTVHDLETIATQAATCTKEGREEHKKCNDCGKYFTMSGSETTLADLAIEKLNHVGSFDDYGVKTCTECGYVQYQEPNMNIDEDSPFYEYYKIENAGQLAWFRDYVNDKASSGDDRTACAYLVNSFSMSPVCHPADDANGIAKLSWEPIGFGLNGTDKYWLGVFNGNGKTLSDLYIDNGITYTALFGTVGQQDLNSTVENICNLTLEDVNVKCHSGGAAVVANHYSGIISNVKVLSGTVTVPSMYASGIAIQAKGIKDCVNKANVTTKQFACGIGKADYVKRCSNYGTITTTEARSVAGISCKAVSDSLVIQDCANYGDVVAEGVDANNNYCYPSGIVALGSYCIIRNCANFGNIYVPEGLETNGGFVVYAAEGLKLDGMLVNSGTLYKNNVATDCQIVAGDYEEYVDNSIKYSATATEVASGKVAYMLQSNAQEDDTWGQNLSSATKQAYPVLGSNTVYCDSVLCDGYSPADGAKYSNTETTPAIAAHNDGTNPVVHHDASCLTDSYDEHTCSVCNKTYRTNEGNDKTGHKDENEDMICDVCHQLTVTENPVLVTNENYKSLGLTKEYVGYEAISNLAQLAGFAAQMNAPMTLAVEPEEEEDGPVKAKAMSLFLPDADAKMMAVTLAEDGSAAPVEKKYVLTADIVVNDSLLNENGMPKDHDADGEFRTDLLAWNSPAFCEGNPMLNSMKVTFDGNNHTISGLYLNTPGNDDTYAGFVSIIGAGSSILNLGITDSYFQSSKKAYALGSLAGVNVGEIVNCWSDATVDINYDDTVSAGIYKSSFAPCAGLISYVANGNVKGCSFKGKVINNAAKYFGGVIGTIMSVPMGSSLDTLTVADCHFSGKAINNVGYKDDYAQFGPIAAAIGNYGSVLLSYRCYADGDIENNGKLKFSGFASHLSNAGFVISALSYNVMSLSKPGIFQYNGYIGSAKKISSDEDEGGMSAFLLNYDYNRYDPFNPVPFLTDSVAQSGIRQMYNFYLSDTQKVILIKETQSYIIGATENIFQDGSVGGLLTEYGMMLAEDVPELMTTWYQQLGVDKYPVLYGDEYTALVCDIELEIVMNKPRHLEKYEIIDGEAYDLKHDFLVDSLTYKRTVSESQVGNWQPLYVPFQISYNDLADKGFDVASINNFHEYTDEDGNVEDMELEVRLIKKGKLKANHPYLIRPKTAGEMQFVIENDSIYKATATSISCSSIERKYTFTGTYEPVTGMATKGYLFLSGGMLRKAASDETTLKAQRWYLSMESLDGQYEEEEGSVMLAKPMAIVVIGEDDATGIEDIQVTRSVRDAHSAQGIYDLQGRKLSGMTKGLNIVRQSDGSVKKYLVE